MFLIVEGSSGYGLCSKSCFGPVWKVRIYNALSSGFLHINGRQVLANSTGRGEIYKISQGSSFFLYDAIATKFICWNFLSGALAAKKYRPSRMDNCTFSDDISNNPYFRNSYVNLVWSQDKNFKMSFNRQGRFSKKPCKNIGRKKKRRRNSDKCLAEATSFLIVPIENHTNTRDRDPCSCPEAYAYFCRTRLKHMRELRRICSTNDDRTVY